MSGVLAMLALQCSLERASAQPASVGAVAVEHCGISGSYLQSMRLGSQIGSMGFY